MEYSDILDHLVPRGLSFGRCFVSINVDIGHHDKKLQSLLGNFDIYAERFSNFLPEFKDYPSFKKMLAFFTVSDCPNYRLGTCKYINCDLV
jgi:hypothetical protein